MVIGNKKFDFENHFYIMGVLNVTPDSFSDGGKYYDVDAALRHVEEMIKEGADIIDIGGESTRPGYSEISEDFEIYRVAPVIEKIKSSFDVPVSLDTYKYKVASAGIEAGVDMINDIWGLKWDKLKTADENAGDTVKYAMANVIAKADIPCCIMHNRAAINTNDLNYVNHDGDNANKNTASKNDYDYVNFFDDVMMDIKESINIACSMGISKDNIIIDPGIGFAKDLKQNYIVMKHLSAICKLCFPVLLGTSRKSMIGLTLNLPTNERVEGTIATSVIGYQAGCRIFRVHDIKENRRALLMTEAIMNVG